MRIWYAVLAVTLLSTTTVAADPDEAAAETAMSAFQDAIDARDAAAVARVLASKVRIRQLRFADAACRKAFRPGRKVRGAARIRLARCLTTVRPSPVPPAIGHLEGGWTIEVYGVDARLVAGRGGAMTIAELDEAGPRPPVQVGLLTSDKRDKAYLDAAIADPKVQTSLNKFLAVKGSRTPEAGRATAPATTPAAANGLGEDEIDDVFQRHYTTIHACYDKELVNEPNLPLGSVVVDVAIEPDGKVSNVTVVSSRVKSPAVERCATAAVSRLRFPAARARSRIQHSLLFGRPP